MDAKTVNRILKKLKFAREKGGYSASWDKSMARELLEQSPGNDLASIDNEDLKNLYSIVLGKGIPWGPYSVPDDVLIKAMTEGKPIDIEKYRIKELDNERVLF